MNEIKLYASVMLTLVEHEVRISDQTCINVAYHVVLDNLGKEAADRAKEEFLKHYKKKK